MNENNNSKARVYSLFAVALLLMGIGLFGGFYTLMGGINTSKLAGKMVIDHYDYTKPISVKCNNGGSITGYLCKDKLFLGMASLEESNPIDKCKDMGYSQVIREPKKIGGKSDYKVYCYKEYSPKVTCPKNTTVIKRNMSYECKKAVYKEVYPISCSSNRVAGKQFKCTIGGDLRSGSASIASGNCTLTGINYGTVGVTCKSETYVKIRYVQGNVSTTSDSYHVKPAPTTKSKKNSTTKKKVSNPTTTTTTKAPLKDISLKCKTKDGNTLKDGATITVYRPVTCTVNTNGVKFKATGKKAVTLTGSNKKYSFNYIKGKETATIKVSKSGYKAKTIKFKVTDDMKITSNSKKAFKIYCPTKVRVGDKFICYVSEEYRGAVITTTFDVEKPVEAKKNTKILYLKYDKPGSLVVSAKYGKKTYSRTVKVIDKEASKKTKVHLNCSRTEVKANEKFYCFSRIDGVQIKIDSKCKLNSGFDNTKLTDFSNNLRKYKASFSCSKGNNIETTITATKDGYVSNSKTINIK